MTKQMLVEDQYSQSLLTRNSQFRKWFAVTTVMLSMLAATMSSTMVNVAIPRITIAFQIGQDTAQLLSSGFLAATSCAMLLNAWLVGRYGIRRVFIWSILLFCCSSIAAQIAPNFLSMAIARTIQGASTGVLQPLALTVILVLFDRDERVLANGIFGMGVVLGPVLGPIVGGLAIDHIGWHYVFGAPLPIAALAVVSGAWSLPDRCEQVPARDMNWLSFALIAIAVTSLLLGLSSVRDGYWPQGHAAILLVLFVISTAAFAIVELRTDRPVIERQLFVDKVFAMSSIIAVIFSAGLFGSIYLIAVACQEVHGFSPSDTGLLMTVSSIILVFLYPIAGRLFMKANASRPIALGLGLFALSSTAWSCATTAAPFWLLTAWTTVGRVGLGLITTCLNVGAVVTLRGDLLLHAAGTLSFIRMLGGAIGVSALAIYVERETDRFAEMAARTTSPAPEVAGRTIPRPYDLISRWTGAGDIDSACAATQSGNVELLCAKQFAFQNGFLLLALAFSLAAILALTMGKHRRQG